MNVNLRILHRGALSAWLEFKPEAFSDTVRSRLTLLCMITLFMIWHTWYGWLFPSKSLFNRFSPRVRDCFFFQFKISYVVLFCCRDWKSVIQIRKFKYFTHLSMYVLHFMCDCIVSTNIIFKLLWDYMHLYFISYIFMLIWWRIRLHILCTLKYFLASF